MPLPQPSYELPIKRCSTQAEGQSTLSHGSSGISPFRYILHMRRRATRSCDLDRHNLGSCPSVGTNDKVALLFPPQFRRLLNPLRHMTNRPQSSYLVDEYRRSDGNSDSCNCPFQNNVHSAT